MKKPPDLLTVMLWTCVAALAVAVVLSAVGCATPTEYRIALNPATGEGTATLSKVGLVEPVAGLRAHEADVTVPPEGFSWLTVGLSVLAGIGGLQFAGPKSWANWATILKPSSTWKATGQSAAAVVGLAHTPQEAKA